ncbi:MAG: cysteine hydrolase [Lactobacillaceae bacterium]|jgi:nicotinamidase/pyrazinamidase|nr:cysteine hydrolase [Lactobacillaceae bacterium]
MKKRTLVIVDFQNDFVHPNGALTVNSPELIERMKQFAKGLQKDMFERILITADNHDKDAYHLIEEAELFPPHCLKGSWGWEYAVDLNDNIPCMTLYKEGNDIWDEEHNYKELQENWEGREVYIAGLVSDICVKKAMDGFLKRGAKVTVFEDLTQGLEKSIKEVISDDKYKSFVASGAVSCITARQFGK